MDSIHTADEYQLAKVATVSADGTVAVADVDATAMGLTEDDLFAGVPGAEALLGASR
jgi:hypothetical protein